MKKWFLGLRLVTVWWAIMVVMCVMIVAAVSTSAWSDSAHKKQLADIAAKYEKEDRRQDAEKRHQWDVCLAQHGVPVMGYGYRVVCIDEEHVREIDGRKY